MRSLLAPCLIALLVGLAPAALQAEDGEPGPRVGEKQVGAHRAPPPSPSVEPMQPEEPMPIGMRREGMKKGDVAQGAQRKKQYMEEMMEQERAGTPGRHRRGSP